MEQTTRIACPHEEALEAFAAGADEPGVPDHLQSCPICRARLQEMRENNRFLMEVRARGMTPADPLPPDFIPGYQLLEEIHRGGQGVVYKAVQIHTKRKVAVKLLLPGRKSSDRHRIRFEQEISLAASLRHPNIVTVLDCVSPRDGRLGYAMEYVRGRPLDDWAQGHGFSPVPSLQDKVRLFIKVCEAVQYAHRRGIIHRDLKPGNILVDGEGEPRLCDFGVAKTGLADAAQTATGEFIGTLAYASPEQVAGVPEAIDTRSDVYGLGVVLYELVTGAMPHDLEGPLPEVARRIQSVEPRRPFLPGGRLSADLETIILKALAKEPERRYQSPLRLAEDLRRYLSGEMIEARRASGWYVLRRTAKKHWAAVAIASAFVMLIGGFGLVWRAHAMSLKAALSQSTVDRALAQMRIGNAAPAERSLWRELLTDPAGRERWGPHGPALPTSVAWWALWSLYAEQPCERAARLSAHAVTLMMPLPGRDDRVLLADAGGTLTLVDAADLAAVRRSGPSDDAGNEARAGVRAGAITLDGRVVTVHADGMLRRWDAATLSPLGGPVQVAPSGEFYARFTDDGLLLGVGGASTIRVIETRERNLGAERARFEHTLGANQFPVFLAGGIEILFRQPGGFVLHPLEAAGPPCFYPIPDTRHAFPHAFSHDRSALYFMLFGAPRVLDLSSGAVATLAVIPRVSRASAFTLAGDHSRFAIAGEDNRISVWGLAPSRRADPPLYLVGHSSAASSALFTGDGEGLLTADTGGVVRRWDLSGGARHLRPMLGHTDTIFAAVVAHTAPAGAAGGTLVYTASADGTVRAWGSDDGHERFRSAPLGGVVDRVAVSADGDVVAAAVRAGDQRSDIVMLDGRLRPTGTIAGAHRVRCADLAFGPADRVLASVGDDSALRLWSTATREPLGTRTLRDPASPDYADSPLRSITFSPDQSRIAWAGQGGLVCLSDPSLSTGVRTLPWTGHTGYESLLRCVRFSPDGRFVAAAGNDYTIRVWHAASGRLTHAMSGHTGVVYGLSFSPDGRLLASCSADGSVRLWDARRGTGLADLRDEADHGHPRPGPEGRQYFSVAFLPDGGRLVVCGNAGYLATWDLRAYEPRIAGNLDYWARTLRGDGVRATDAAIEWAREHARNARTR